MLFCIQKYWKEHSCVPFMQRVNRSRGFCRKVIEVAGTCSNRMLSSSLTLLFHCMFSFAVCCNFFFVCLYYHFIPYFASVNYAARKFKKTENTRWQVLNAAVITTHLHPHPITEVPKYFHLHSAKYCVMIQVWNYKTLQLVYDMLTHKHLSVTQKFCCCASWLVQCWNAIFYSEKVLNYIEKTTKLNVHYTKLQGHRESGPECYPDITWPPYNWSAECSSTMFNALYECGEICHGNKTGANTQSFRDIGRVVLSVIILTIWPPYIGLPQCSSTMFDVCNQDDIGTTQNLRWTWRLLFGTRSHCTCVPEVPLIWNSSVFLRLLGPQSLHNRNSWWNLPWQHTHWRIQDDLKGGGGRCGRGAPLLPS